jgi:voltage-gated potassium channel
MAHSQSERQFSTAFETFFQLVIFYSLGTYFIEMELGSQNADEAPFFVWSERIVAGAFSIEYVLRWVRSRRWSYPVTAAAIIDLLAVLPFYLGFLVDLRALRLVRTLRMLRLFKLHRYNAALHAFAKSMRSARDQLGALSVVVMFFVTLSSSILFECERSAQPKVFAKFTDAVWWCITTLTTVGYGDKYPITAAGRIAATLTVVFGLGIFGTFISIIGGAFMQTQRSSSTLRVSQECYNRLACVVQAAGSEVNEATLSHAIECLINGTKLAPPVEPLSGSHQVLADV